MVSLAPDAVDPRHVLSDYISLAHDLSRFLVIERLTVSLLDMLLVDGPEDGAEAVIRRCRSGHLKNIDWLEDVADQYGASAPVHLSTELESMLTMLFNEPARQLSDRSRLAAAHAVETSAARAYRRGLSTRIIPSAAEAAIDAVIAYAERQADLLGHMCSAYSPCAFDSSAA